MLERRNPLPKGFYWYAVAPQHQPGFDSWVRLSHVRVLKSVKESGPQGQGRAARERGGYTWTLFEVASPSMWPEGFGFPNIAEKGAATDRADTIQEPPPEKDIADQIGDVVKETGEGIKTAALVAAALLLVYAVVAGRK